jgi:hypothetical protein
MAVDFGLLNSNQLPMKAAPSSFDYPGSVQAGYTLAGQRIKTEEAAQGQQDANQDRDVLKQAMQNPEFDIYTPTGVDKALEGLKGKLSPSGYENLMGHATKLKQADAQLKSSIASMDEKTRQATAERVENTMPLLDGLLKQYDKDASEKGQQYAEQKLKESGGALHAKLSASPGYSPEVLSHIESGNAENLKALYAGSKYKHGLLVNAELEARAAKEKALEEQLKTGGKPGSARIFVDSAGNKYDVTPGRNIAMKNGTEPIPLSELPADVKPLGVKGAGTADTGSVPLTDEENRFMAEYQFRNGKPIPGLPVGTGAAAAAARLAYLKSFVSLAKEKGLNPEQMAESSMARSASAEAMKKLTSQTAVMEAAEKNVANVVDMVEKEVKKLGGPDSPKLRSIWNKGMSEWAGDPEFTTLNLASVDLQEGLAKIYSGNTGAAGVPVKFVELAEKALPKNPSLAQILALKKALPALVGARTDASKSVLEALKSVGELPNSGGGTRTDAQVSPTEQKARDSDAGKVLSQEADKILSGYASAKTTEEKARKWGDVKAIRNEQKRNKTLTEAQSANTARPGDVYKGYIFKGGVASNKENWEKL